MTVSEIEAFVVVVEKYTDHPDNIFKDFVLHQSGGEFNIFLMKDRVAAEQATLKGATPISETSLESPF